MVRTRFGPSPTGALHIGGLRTALFNYLFTRASGGRLVLRIEDTDLERSVAEYEKGIIDDLAWLGIACDEGPEIGGDSGPYRQSERLEIYRGLAERLVEAGLAFRCYCSKERLVGLKRAQAAKNLPPRYDGACRDLSAAPAGVTPAIRFRVEDRTVKFIDAVHGPMSFSTSAFGDFVIIGSDGVASYNFASAVDDPLMEITHVIRGDDHLSNTPRQILVQEALGLRVPSYAHLPLVLGPDRVPLGKRHEGVSIRELKDAGFLPCAILNAAARLGWSPGEGPELGGRLLTIEEMAGEFDLKGISRSPSFFDIDRLKTFNKAAIARMSPEGLKGLMTISFGDLADANEIIAAVKDNATTLLDIEELARPFTGDIVQTGDARKILCADSAKKVIKVFSEEVEKANELTGDTFGEIVKKTGEITGDKGKALFLPIRCALTGRTGGIELQKVVELLGRARVLERLK
jgi:glutamyl-tRNA synthetase